MFSHIHRLWLDPRACRRFRTGVSLHGHTLHSRESLDFIPRIAQPIGWLRSAVERHCATYRRLHGAELDFARAWWTPPLCVRRALDAEASQIRALGLQPLVSLTDHDNIAGAPTLRLVSDVRLNPVSLEWTVPFGPTFFHLGIHNLSVDAAELQAFTADPDPGRLPDLLQAIAADPAALVVFNHPLWDEKGIGRWHHAFLAQQFIRRYGNWIHALELNGLRPWPENALVVQLASAAGFPVISGGDRHGSEPNANLNLTSASTFAEFADEIRSGRRSEVLFMPHYHESFVLRMIHNIGDIVGDHPDHSLGWKLWSDRVFYCCEDGVERSLTALWGGRGPGIVRQFIAASRLIRNRTMRSALRIAFPGREEFVS